MKIITRILALQPMKNQTNKPVFPTILIQSVEPTETNSDLEADRINTVDFTAQDNSNNNRSRSEALQVSML